jgi:WD40 repeat protein
MTVHRLSPVANKNDLLLKSYPIASDIEIRGDNFTEIIDLGGRAVVLSSVIGHVRVWDLEELIAVSNNEKGNLGTNLSIVRSLSAGVLSSSELYVGTYGIVIALDTETGTVRWERRVAEDVSIEGLAVNVAGDVLVAGDINGVIQVLDIASAGSPVRSIRAGTSLGGLRLAEWRGNTLAIATVEEDSRWAVRIWNLQTGEENATERTYQLRGGQQDKWMYGLAVESSGEFVRIAFASCYGKVMVGNFPPRYLNDPHAYREWPVPNTGDEYIRSLTIGRESGVPILAAGTQQGHLAIWNFLSGGEKSAHANAHLGAVSVLCFHRMGNQEVLVSGGIDGVLRFWTTKLRELFSIELGEAINAMAWVDVDRLAAGTVRGLLMVQLDIEKLTAMGFGNGFGERSAL